MVCYAQIPKQVIVSYKKGLKLKHANVTFTLEKEKYIIKYCRLQEVLSYRYHIICIYYYCVTTFKDLVYMYISFPLKIKQKTVQHEEFGVTIYSDFFLSFKLKLYFSLQIFMIECLSLDFVLSPSLQNTQNVHPEYME